MMAALRFGSCAKRADIIRTIKPCGRSTLSWTFARSRKSRAKRRWDRSVILTLMRRFYFRICCFHWRLWAPDFVTTQVRSSITTSRLVLTCRLYGEGRDLAAEMNFQAEAMKLIRKELSPEKGLLGFVGGPLTLFCYAVDGSHSGGLESSRQGLRDGRFEDFSHLLLDLLAENMALQARAGADTIAVLDTCAGEFDANTYTEIAVPVLKELLKKFKTLCPETPITYYSKGSGPDHWKALTGLPIAALGVDWHHNIAQVLDRWSDQWAIQGNVDPDWLFLEPAELEKRLHKVFVEAKALPSVKRRGWVCGLGHGVLPKTPESNVRLFLKLQKEIFG